MQDRTHTVQNRTITLPPVAPPVQQDEFLRQARIATAQAAVDTTSRRLANTHLPMNERYELAREHEANLHHLAVLRIENGTATPADRRLTAIGAQA